MRAADALTSDEQLREMTLARSAPQTIAQAGVIDKLTHENALLKR